MPNIFDQIEPYKFPCEYYTIIGDKSEIDAIIRAHGYINIDIGDVERALSKSAPNYVTTGYGKGENGLIDAFNQSLNKLPVSLSVVSSILFNIYVSKTNSILMRHIGDFLNSESYCNSMNDIDGFVCWGVAIDESLGDEIKITLIAASK